VRRRRIPELVLATALFAASLTPLGSCGESGRKAGPDASAADSAASDAPQPPAPEGGSDSGWCAGPESDVPTIAIGLDAYRQWDRWPYLHIGERAYTRSTYDRAGGNEGADASHYLRLTSDRAVALDVAGTGVLYFTRANHWHGSPWHDVVDGRDFAVSETATVDPDVAVPDSSFLPAAAFPPPLAMTWSTTQGSDVSGVPIAFGQSLQVAYERTHYGTGYFSYHLFPTCAGNLSSPIQPWSEQAPAADVVALVAQAGQDIAPSAAAPRVTSLGGTVALTPGAPSTVLDLVGPSTLRALTFTVAATEAEALGAATLQITWDGRASPSIEAPVSLFFGAGSMANRDGREYLVRAFPVSIRLSSGLATFATYFPMPLQRSAHVALVGGTAAATVTWSARSQPYTDPPSWAGYLHATYVDQRLPIPGADLVMLDTTTTEGGGDWCGQIVGTSFVFSDAADLSTLEGDPRFFFDDSQTPQVQGTGTEEWGGGGDYWGGLETTLPFFGHPVGAPSAGAATSSEDEIESAYRFLLADAMPFGRNARIQLEHGGTDDSTDHYRTLVYWYGLPGACLVQTDALHVSDPADEAAHHYVSPDAQGIDSLTTRYEWGVDTIPLSDGGSQVIYPPSSDTGRHTSGTSELTLAIRPDNLGVLLRRKLDYGYPDQRAEVYVADASSSTPAFVDVGAWYLAGSNRCVFSDPAGELDPFQPAVETSNRRWRDDEFLIPRALTEGRAALRVRLVFSPTNAPLLPGDQAPVPSAWSEYRYSAYVWTLPPAP
jgi:hypothetical protein